METKDDNRFQWAAGIMVVFYLLAAPVSLFMFFPAVPVYAVAWIIALTIVIKYGKIPAPERKQLIGGWYPFSVLVLIHGPAVLLIFLSMIRY